MLASLLLLGAFPSGTPEAARAMTKGAALYHSCQAEVRLMDLPSLSQATAPDLIDGSFCVGFVNGFLGNPGGRAVCTEGANVGTVVRTYVAFLAGNPRLLEEDRRVGLEMALQQVYPCRVTEQPKVEDPSSAHARTVSYTAHGFRRRGQAPVLGGGLLRSAWLLYSRSHD